MIVIVALTIVGYILFSSLVQTKAELATAKTTITAYTEKIKQNEAIRKGFELSHKNLTIMYSNTEEKSRKDKAREYIAASKPTLVEKFANRKFRKSQRELACITGNTSKCD